MKSLFAWTLIVACLAGTATGRDDAALTCSVEKVHYGLLLQGANSQQRFELKNPGDDAIGLTAVRCGSDAFRVRMAAGRLLNVPIAADGSVEVELAANKSAKLVLSVDTSRLAAGTHETQLTVATTAGEVSIPVSVEVKERQRPAQLPSNPVTPPPPAAPAGPAGRILVTEPDHDFGPLLIGESAVHEFHFKNDGEHPLQIKAIMTSCNCTGRVLKCGDTVMDSDEIKALERSGETVLDMQPGQEASLEVEMVTTKLAPTPPGRPLTKYLTITSNDPENPRLRLSVSAELQDAISAEPSTLRIPPIRRGESMRAKVRLHSEHIEGYRLTDVIVPVNKGLAASWTELEGGAAPVYEIEVTVLDTAQKGRIADALVFQIDHDRVQEKRVQIFAEVTSQVTFVGNQERGLPRLDFKVLDGSQDETRELGIENLHSDHPYVPGEVLVTSRNGTDHFKTETVCYEEGKKYGIRLTVSKDIPDRFFSGKLRITSEHPDEKVRMIDFRGWMNRTTPEPDKDGAQDSDRR